VRELLVESLVLALVGGALGVVLAMWGVDAVARGAAQRRALGPIGVDLGVLGFALAATTATGALFGLRRRSPRRASTRTRRCATAALAPPPVAARARARLLVTAEIALSAALVVAATLLVVSFARLSSVDPGFAAGELVTSHVFLPDSRYGAPGRGGAFYRTLSERLASLPGVRSAASASRCLLEHAPRPLVHRRRRAAAAPGPGAGRDAARGQPRLLRDPGIRWRPGAASPRRGRAAGPPVAVISQALARRTFGDADPLGRHLVSIAGPGSYEIVGVAGDIRAQPSASGPSPRSICRSAGRRPVRDLRAAHVAGRRLAGDARRRRGLDRLRPAAGATATMTAAIRESLARQRLESILLGIFGAMAVALAVVGVYGVCRIP